MVFVLPWKGLKQAVPEDLCRSIVTTLVVAVKIFYRLLETEAEKHGL